MSIINKQPIQVPLVNKDGTITREWWRYFDQIFIRVGGTEGQTNTELVQDQYGDAGIEEMRHELFKARDELSLLPPPIPAQEYQDQAPTGAFFMPAEDPHSRIEALEAMVALLAREIDALKQGYQL